MTKRTPMKTKRLKRRNENTKDPGQRIPVLATKDTCFSEEE